MLEKNLQRKIIRRLEQIRADGGRLWWLKIHGGPMQMAGVPDLLVILDGKPLFVELKALTGKVSLLQNHTMDRIREAGARTAVVRSVEDFDEIINLMD